MAANDIIRTIKHKEQTLKQTKGQARSFESALYRALDTREDVLYNLADKAGLRAYEQSERFRKSGLTKAQLAALVQRATQSGTVQNIPAQEYEKTIQPAYRVKENSVSSTIHTTGIPPQVYPIAQTVYEAHRQNGTLVALIASYTGTRVTDAAAKAEHKAVTKTVERTVAVPIGQPAAVNSEQAAYTRSTIRPAHGDAETRTRTLGTAGAAGSTESTSTATVSQSHTAGKNAQHTAEHSPALSAADKEKLRMARINANYEHDKKLLAKTDPLFAKNRFWDVGHAEQSEKITEQEIQRNTRRMKQLINQKIREKAGF